MATIGLVTATSPTSDDAAIRTRLLARGHEVTYVDHAVQVPAGFAAFVITSSATDLASSDKYASAAVPVVCLNIAASVQLGMANATTATGSSSASYELLTNHEIAKGLVSPAAIVESAQSQPGRAWANVGSGGQPFAKGGASPTVYTGWSFKTGTSLVGGVPAPARRVHLTMPNTYLSAGTLTEQGWALFERSVDWALNINEFPIDGTEVATWIGPDGYQVQLNVQWELDGWRMPPVSFIEEVMPNRPGSVLRRVRHDAREITVPVWIRGNDYVDLQNKIRAIVASMDPARGPGVLQVTAPDGAQRRLVVRYQDGLGMPEKLGESTGLHFQRADIIFKAHMPYWEDMAEQVYEYVVADPLPFFPLFPMVLSASTIVATVPIVNNGDVITWPTWKIVGPGSAIQLINHTTGEKIDLSNNGGIELGSGEWIDIDTTEGVKSVRLNDGTNLFPYLSTDSSLWHLERGTNNISLAMGDSENGVSRLVLNYRQRYLSV